mgnify:FL=1
MSLKSGLYKISLLENIVSVLLDDLSQNFTIGEVRSCDILYIISGIQTKDSTIYDCLIIDLKSLILGKASFYTQELDLIK